MSHKLLKDNAEITSIDIDELPDLVEIDTSAPEKAIEKITQLSKAATVLMNLSSSSDGRAFSVLSHLGANSSEERPTFWIGGELIPDQITLALQCGADAVLVSEAAWHERGAQGWTQALNPCVTRVYRRQVWAKVGDISRARTDRLQAHI